MWIVFSLLAGQAALPGADSYLAGREAELRGRYADSVAAFDLCAALDGPLASYAKVRSAAARTRAGDPKGGISSLTLLSVSSRTAEPWQLFAQARLADSLVRQRDYAQAVYYFDRAIQSPYALWWIEDYAQETAENRLNVSYLRDEGLEYFRNLARTTIYFADRKEAAAALVRSPYSSDRVLAAWAYARARSYDDARTSLSTLTPAELRDPVVRAEYELVRARLYLGAGATEAGHVRLQDIASEYRGTEPARQAYLLIAEDMIGAGKYAEAERVVRTLTTLYPATNETRDAHWRLAVAYDREDDFDRARLHYEAVASDFPSHNRAREALLALGHLERRANDNKRAAGYFERVVENYPLSDEVPEAGFWAGALLETARLRDTAHDHYRRAAGRGITHYYGHRAQAALVRLGVDRSPRLPMLSNRRLRDLVRPMGRDNGELDLVLPRLRDDARFARLEFFASHGFEEAEWEAFSLIRNIDDHAQPERVYRALGEAGTAYTAMQVANAQGFGENPDGTLSDERIRIRFPLAYWPIVRTLGRETDVDPYLLLSMARQESTYRPSLTSIAGAKGVMQLMPDTARWLAGVDDNITEYHISNLNDPHNSLRLGAFYYRRMLDEFAGDPVFALAAYNAGPGNCRKWVGSFGDVPAGEFIERIPFTETRNYVKRILGYYATYHSVYPRAR